MQKVGVCIESRRRQIELLANKRLPEEVPGRGPAESGRTLKGSSGQQARYPGVARSDTGKVLPLGHADRVSDIPQWVPSWVLHMSWSRGVIISGFMAIRTALNKTD